jgi:hypothetical protein
MPPSTRRLLIEERFCGPPGAANGGIAGGVLAALLDEAVPPAAEVTLRRPVPLARPFTARRGGDSEGGGCWLVADGDQLVAEVRPAPRVEFAVPAAVTFEEAQAAAGRAPYFADPVFPACFGCGPARAPGDGLRIFPGPVDGVMAAPWTPDPAVTDADGGVLPEVVWAALDCPSGIAAGDALRPAGGEPPRDIAVVLGRMTATVAAPPRTGDRCRVIAWTAGRDGRKLYARAALLGPGDAVLAAADSVWLSVPRQAVVP